MANLELAAELDRVNRYGHVLYKCYWVCCSARASIRYANSYGFAIWGQCPDANSIGAA
jgi:hypothetical protein